VQRSKHAPGTPEDWLARAEGDLALAKVPLPEGGYYEDLCFHAQQAAEKAIKAIYVRHGLAFRYTHDLGELIASLEKAGIKVPPEITDATILTGYAWEARYPGTSEPVTVKGRVGSPAVAGYISPPFSPTWCVVMSHIRLLQLQI